MSYQKEHYQQLLTQTLKSDMVSELAEANLKQMDAFL